MQFVKMNETGKIEVDITELNNMIYEYKILSLLEDYGVDNWHGYDDAIHDVEEVHGFIENIDSENGIEKLTGISMYEYQLEQTNKLEDIK